MTIPVPEQGPYNPLADDVPFWQDDVLDAEDVPDDAAPRPDADVNTAPGLTPGPADPAEPSAEPVEPTPDPGPGPAPDPDPGPDPTPAEITAPPEVVFTGPTSSFTITVTAPSEEDLENVSLVISNPAGFNIDDWQQRGVVNCGQNVYDV